jgi:outer membrane receptor protein involved in Fe transport
MKRAAFLVLTWIAGAARAQEFGASAKVRVETAPASTTITREQANDRPAALGEPGRALLDAPGAVRSSYAGDGLILWGATPEETHTYVDGVELPRLFHPTGLRTTVHPTLIEQLMLTPGALPAEYGRGLGGAVELETVALQPGVRGELRADAIDSSLSASGGSAGMRARVGLRYGYFDRVLRRLAPRSQDLIAVPSHADGVVRIELHTHARTRLSATWMGARDRVTVRPDSGQQTRAAQFHVVSVRLVRRYADGARMRLTPFFSRDTRSERSLFARVPLSLAREGFGYGLRADFQQTLSSAISVRVGLDLRGACERLERQGTLSLPAREGDLRAFGQAPVEQLARDDWRVSTLNAAPWAQLTLRWRWLTVAPGLRLEGYLLSVSRQLPTTFGIPAVGHDAITLFPEPRLAIGVRAHERLRFEARVAWVHQLPDASDLSASFGNPRLSPARGVHGALATRADLPAQLTLDLTGFVKELRALAVRTSESPAVLGEQLVSHGRGSTLGVSLSLRRELRALSLALSYMLSRSLRSDPDGSLRRFDFDQPHVFSGIIGYARGGFSCSARLRAASGMPRTQVDGRYLDSKTGLAQPLFGMHNRTRLPAYVALDLHAEYALAFDASKLALFADVLNVADRNNVEDLAYASNYTQRRDVSSIPIVAMAGLRIEVEHAR